MAEMMLDLGNRPTTPVGGLWLQDDNEGRKATNAVRLFVLRRYKIVIIIMALSLVAGLFYLKVTRPVYTAGAVIEVADREGRYLHEQATLADTPIDIDREMNFAKSTVLAEAVVRNLHLDQDVDFDPPQNPLVNSLRTLWYGNAPDPEMMRQRTTLSSVQKGMRVASVGAASSFEILFTSADPTKAAVVANALADEFLAHEGDSDIELHKKASDWLDQQSTELRKRAETAEAAVTNFIKTNNLVAVDGKLVDQQKLDDVNRRVGIAKDKMSDTKYKLERITDSLEKAKTSDIRDITSGPEFQQDQTIARARQQYIDLSSQADALQRNYGTDSKKIRDLIATVKADILAELPRLQDNTRHEYDNAAKQYDELLSEQKAAVEASRRASFFEGQLKDLQGTAENYRSLYENFLQHSAASIQELSFPVRAAHIAERASPPTDKSWPKPLIVFAASALGGLALGLGAGLLRDFRDHTFQTGGQFESSTHLKCVGLIPKIGTSLYTVEDLSRRAELQEKFEGRVQMPLWVTIKARPNSRFVSELVAVRLSLLNYCASRGARVIGMTSALPGEGKSSLLSSLAVLMAQHGDQVAIVDLDFRNRTQGDAFGIHNPLGLPDVLAGSCSLEEALAYDRDLGLTVAHCGSNPDVLRPVGMLLSAKLRECILRLRQTYDYVLIDLPPLIPVPDVRATADFIDGYLLTVEWAKTNVELVTRGIGSTSEIGGKIIGGVLNKVDFKALTKYDSLAGLYYMRADFVRYRDHN